MGTDILTQRWYLLGPPWACGRDAGLTVLAGDPDPHAAQIVADLELAALHTEENGHDGPTREAMRAVAAHIVALHNAGLAGAALRSLAAPPQRRDEQEGMHGSAARGPQTSRDRHTPGPWEVGPWHQSVRPSAAAVLAGARLNDGYAICAVYGQRQRPANARLIAAAPDLLEALMLILQNPDHARELLPVERATAEAALGKVAGNDR
ncbi:hypothetical protein [Thiococcus pfennigii]|uniref:hypothetical protein n=1 Tax=Thiococcus pfennigii TaxID=1057 RepID=UPI001902C7D0|nr:hypothetical protein [Thiococcus pfennigii]MBK1732900.1 hypothetical protein [Thiococcus pfennigii]